jgi:nucleoside-diphosphate-sugar epimerase
MARRELPFHIEGRRVWVAGHRGMVGSALVPRLSCEDCELLTIDRAPESTEVEAWMHEPKPQRGRPRGGAGRRHFGERQPPGRFPRR